MLVSISNVAVFFSTCSRLSDTSVYSLPLLQLSIVQLEYIIRTIVQLSGFGSRVGSWIVLRVSTDLPADHPWVDPQVMQLQNPWPGSAHDLDPRITDLTDPGQNGSRSRVYLRVTYRFTLILYYICILPIHSININHTWPCLVAYKAVSKPLASYMNIYNIYSLDPRISDFFKCLTWICAWSGSAGHGSHGSGSIRVRITISVGRPVVDLDLLLTLR